MTRMVRIVVDGNETQSGLWIVQGNNPHDTSISESADVALLWAQSPCCANWLFWDSSRWVCSLCDRTVGAGVLDLSVVMAQGFILNRETDGSLSEAHKLVAWLRYWTGDKDFDFELKVDWPKKYKLRRVP